MADASMFTDLVLGVAQTGKTTLMINLSQDWAAKFQHQLWLSPVDPRCPRYAQRCRSWGGMKRLAMTRSPCLLFVDEVQLRLEDGFLDRLAETRAHVLISAVMATQRPQALSRNSGIRDLSRYFYLFRTTGKALEWIKEYVTLSDEQIRDIETLPDLTCYRYDVAAARIDERIVVRRIEC